MFWGVSTHRPVEGLRIEDRIGTRCSYWPSIPQWVRWPGPFTGDVPRGATKPVTGLSSPGRWVETSVGTSCHPEVTPRDPAAWHLGSFVFGILHCGSG